MPIAYWSIRIEFKRCQQIRFGTSFFYINIVIKLFFSFNRSARIVRCRCCVKMMRINTFSAVLCPVTLMVYTIKYTQQVQYKRIKIHQAVYCSIYGIYGMLCLAVSIGKMAGPLELLTADDILGILRWAFIFVTNQICYGQTKNDSGSVC